MLKKTRIALVSDLHIGREAISTDLCPHELDGSDIVGMETNFLQKFRALVTSPELINEGEIDYLCVTGDISDRADPKEFAHAHIVISQLADSLSVPESRVFFVPGNHDVHWPVMNLEPKDFWDRFRYEPLLQNDLLFKKQLANAESGDFHQVPHFVAWRTDSNIIIGINSAAFDDPKPDDGKHHGLIHSKTLSELELFLETLPYDPTALRVCLVHHHPLNYSDSQPDLADFSAAINAQNLLNLLSKHKFDLLLHGHKHVAQLTHYGSTNNGHPVTVLGAGSLSAQLSSRWCGLAQNQFHIIEVTERDSKTHAAIGHVSTWNFVNRTWREGQHDYGLCAKEGFGTLSTAAELEYQIAVKLDEILKIKDVCRWADLESAIPSLKYVNTKAAYNAIDRIARDRGVEFVGDLNAKKQKWIVLNDTEER